MLRARVDRAPYFAYLCAFAAPGCLSLCIAMANSPLSALAFFVAFPICPLLSVINFWRLRPLRGLSPWHRWAQWASLLSTAIVLLFIIWAVLDPGSRPKHA